MRARGGCGRRGGRGSFHLCKTNKKNVNKIKWYNKKERNRVTEGNVSPAMFWVGYFVQKANFDQDITCNMCDVGSIGPCYGGT